MRYSVTTFEPGARLVFTHGLRLRPRATALRASNPAPTITLGFDVFVQLVMAAITTAPSGRSNETGSSSGLSIEMGTSVTPAPPLASRAVA